MRSAFLMITGLLFLSFSLAAQYGNSYRTSDSVEMIANRLSEIAIDSLGTGVEQANALSARYNWQATRLSWLDDFKVSGNLNEFTINGPVLNPYGYASNVYPRYNIGVTVPLGVFFNQAKQNKREFYKYQAELEMVKKAKEAYKLQVKAAYYNYFKVLQLLALEGDALQNAEFTYKKTEEKFEKGQETLDNYSATNKRYSTEMASKISLENDLRTAKAELESLIGMPLERALAAIRRQIGR